jgi:hypothetical protein
MQELNRPRHNATVVLPGFEIIGQIEPIGPWIDFLNSKDKYVLPMRPARVLPVGGAATAPEHPQVFIRRAEVLLLYLPDRASHSTVHMLKNVQAAIAHAGPLVIRGEIHLGVDSTLATFLDDLPGNFFPVTNAELFSTQPLPVPLPRKADLIFLNREQLQLYYPV